MDGNSNNNMKLNQLFEIANNQNNQIFTNNSNNIFNNNSEFVEPSITSIPTNQNNNNPIENVVINNPLPVVPKKIINNIPQNNIVYKPEKVNKERALEIKNKTLSPVPVTYDDGIDNEDDYPNGITKLLTNKKFLLIIAILILLSVCVVVAKAFYFRKKVDKYEAIITEIENREEEYAKIISGTEIDTETLKKVAATELISCINSKININELPKDVTSVINEINNYYKQSNNYFAFKYVDIYTGFSVSFNENQSIFAASSIKAAKDIYLWKMASQGKINLDDTLTYTSRYYNTGSGLLKKKKFNTNYTIRELLKLSTVDSDNAAHNMLMDNYGRENMLNFWQAKGTNTIFKYNTNWGSTSAHDAAIYMQELYQFYVDNNEYGEAAMNNFLQSYPKFIRNTDGYNIASKSGWSGSSLHDIAIVFADNPYIVVALSNLGDKSYSSYFNTASDLAYKLHKAYWKYKIDKCNDIKQY